MTNPCTGCEHLVNDDCTVPVCPDEIEDKGDVDMGPTDGQYELEQQGYYSHAQDPDLPF